MLLLTTSNGKKLQFLMINFLNFPREAPLNSIILIPPSPLGQFPHFPLDKILDMELPYIKLQVVLNTNVLGDVQLSCNS